MRFRFLLILCIVLFTSLLPAECRGEALLRAAFPYSLTKEAGVAHAGSTQLLYISVQNFGNEEDDTKDKEKSESHKKPRMGD